MKQKFGLGLIGCGSFGRFILKSVSVMDDLMLAALSSRNQESIQRARETWLACRGMKPWNEPLPRMYTDWHGLLQDESVDIVVIATPPSLHREMAMEAARQGKHILLEKPGGLCPRDIEQVCCEASRQGVLASVNFVMRFHPYYRLVRDIMLSGVLGRLERVRIENEAHGDLPPDHWFWKEEESGGIFVEHSVHFFDVCLWVIGPAMGVQALALNGRGEDETPDRVFASVIHRAGDAEVLAQHYHAFTRPSGMARAEAVFTFERGYIRIEGWIPIKLDLDAFADNYALDFFKGRQLGGFMKSESLGPYGRRFCSRITAFEATHRLKLHLKCDDYEGMYSQCIRSSVADLISAIHKRSPAGQ